MSEKTFRAEYAISPMGPRVESLARALASMTATSEPQGGRWEAWEILSLPTLHAGPMGEQFGFGACCSYQGTAPGWVVLFVSEEQMVPDPEFSTEPPFQQCFLGFIDCRVEPPPTLSPVELFNPYTQKSFTREPMWSVPPAQALVARTLARLSDAWRTSSPGSTGFEQVSGS